MNDAIDIPKTEPTRREWLKYCLALQGFTLGELSRKQGLSRTAAGTALWRQYPRMEAAIAEVLGLQPESIWPERYDQAGVPLRKQRGRPPGKANSTRPARRRAR